MLGLLAAWGAARLATWPPTARFTYGWGRSTILAALGNAVVLLVGTGALALEAVQRLFNPGPVAGWPVAGMAAAAILVNGGTALLFMRGRAADLNLRGAFQHMAADAAVSAGGGRGGRGDPADRGRLAGPGGQPGHRRRDRVGHVGPVAGRHRPGHGCRSP